MEIAHPQQHTRKSNFWSLIPFLAAVAIVATLGSFGTQSGQGWYDSLEQPAFNPPGWTFSVVWTALYVLIAVSGWLAWRNRAEPRGQTTLVLWAVQLILNLGWTYIFFAMERPGFALIEIVALDVVIVAFMASAWSVSRTASLLMTPYLAWVLFATALNFEYWRIN